LLMAVGLVGTRGTRMTRHAMPCCVLRLLVWALGGIVVVGYSQVGFAQGLQDEVHILARSTPARNDALGLTLKANVDLVLVNVAVTDSDDRFVSNLKAEDFSVVDGKHAQQIRYFATEDAPLSVAIVLDTSRSMRSNSEQARRAAMEFFQYSNPRDEFAVVTFADRPRLLAGFTDSPDEIEAALQPVEADGFTALWDAVYLALAEMRKARYGKKAVLLISDGGDNQSRYTLSEIKAILKEADVQLFAIDIYERYPKTPEEKSGLLALDEATGVTGGRVFLTHGTDEVRQAVKQISDELRTQYVLGYSLDPSARDGKWHKIKISMNPPNSKKLRVYAKKGYYAPVDR